MFAGAEGGAAVAVEEVAVIALLGGGMDPVTANGLACGRGTAAGEAGIQGAEGGAAVIVDEVLVVALLGRFRESVAAEGGGSVRCRVPIGERGIGECSGREIRNRREDDAQTGAVTDLPRGAGHAHFALFADGEEGIPAAGGRWDGGDLREEFHGGTAGLDGLALTEGGAEQTGGTGDAGFALFTGIENVVPAHRPQRHGGGGTGGAGEDGGEREALAGRVVTAPAGGTGA